MPVTPWLIVGRLSPKDLLDPFLGFGMLTCTSQAATRSCRLGRELLRTQCVPKQPRHAPLNCGFLSSPHAMTSKPGRQDPLNDLDDLAATLARGRTCRDRPKVQAQIEAILYNPGTLICSSVAPYLDLRGCCRQIGRHVIFFRIAAVRSMFQAAVGPGEDTWQRRS